MQFSASGLFPSSCLSVVRCGISAFLFLYSIPLFEQIRFYPFSCGSSGWNYYGLCCSSQSCTCLGEHMYTSVGSVPRSGIARPQGVYRTDTVKHLCKMALPFCTLTSIVWRFLSNTWYGQFCFMLAMLVESFCGLNLYFLPNEVALSFHMFMQSACSCLLPLLPFIQLPVFPIDFQEFLMCPLFCVCDVTVSSACLGFDFSGF